MCNAFSCILKKDGQILRHPNPHVHSHYAIEQFHKLHESRHLTFQDWIKVECHPTHFDYTTHPDKWEFYTDEAETPLWYESNKSDLHESIHSAALKWWTEHVKDGCYLIQNIDGDAIEHVIYMRNGMLHREDGPAKITYNIADWPKQTILQELYFHYERLHREDGPAQITYFDNGQIRWAMYYHNNNKHRINGPALTQFYYNGTIKSVTYYQHDRIHRTDGPAVIQYDEQGMIINEEFWNNRSKLLKP